MTLKHPDIITMYGADWCSDCVRAKAFLDGHGITYRAIDVDADSSGKNAIHRLNHGKNTIPVIVFPDGDILVEPSNEELAAKLEISMTAEQNGASGQVRRLIIIGSGPAGYTAALYAARASLNPIVYAGYQHGGQLMLTTEVENYPGFETGIMGPQLMAQMREQAERFGAEMRDRDVTAVDFSQRPFKVVAGEGSEQEIEYAEAVIVATGASAKWLEIPGEDDYRGYGVSSCATCDGFFFRGKRIAVVGGGDVAMEEAIFLSRFASELFVIHRRDTLRASKTMQERAQANPKIQFIWDTVVDEVIGERDPETNVPRVNALKLRNVKSGEEQVMPMDALFVAIGHQPNTAIFEGQIPLNDHGYAVAKTADGTETEVEGVFVAGDVRDFKYRQAVTAAGDGCKAAMDAERWLEAQGEPVDHTHEVYAGMEEEPLAQRLAIKR